MEQQDLPKWEAVFAAAATSRQKKFTLSSWTLNIPSPGSSYRITITSCIILGQRGCSLKSGEGIGCYAGVNQSAKGSALSVESGEGLQIHP